jgi:hypothetical protein
VWYLNITKDVFTIAAIVYAFAVSVDSDPLLSFDSSLADAVGLVFSAFSKAVRSIRLK